MSACQPQQTSLTLTPVGNNNVPLVATPSTVSTPIENKESISSTPTATSQPTNIPHTEGTLFTEVEYEGEHTFGADPIIIRFRFVEVNFAQLSIATDNPPDITAINDYLILNLFEDATYTARLDRVELHPRGGFTWLGQLENFPHSQATLVINQGILFGKVVTPEKTYEIRPINDDVHAIVEIDQSAFPEESEPIEVP